MPLATWLRPPICIHVQRFCFLQRLPLFPYLVSTIALFAFRTVAPTEETKEEVQAVTKGDGTATIV